MTPQLNNEAEETADTATQTPSIQESDNEVDNNTMKYAKKNNRKSSGGNVQTFTKQGPRKSSVGKRAKDMSKKITQKKVKEFVTMKLFNKKTPLKEPSIEDIALDVLMQGW